MTFQAYLIEGLARWNMQRSEDSRASVEKVPRSFDISLKHRLNALSTSLRNEPALPSFCTPPACTPELIGMSYLRSQNGDLPGDVQELDREIDEAFGDFEVEEDEDPVVELDETVALPEDSSDSGNEAINLISSALYSKHIIRIINPLHLTRLLLF